MSSNPAYLSLRYVPDLLPVCPIHQHLGLLCPGCGGTHAGIALVHGRLAEAWHDNALLLLLAPLLALYAAALIDRLRRGHSHPFPPVPTPAIYGLLLAATIFTVARNLPR